MQLFRITQVLYADDLSGNGSRLFGGRWNSEGHYALYTASSRSLALLETLAHIPVKLLHSKSYIIITLDVPDKVSMEIIHAKDLPPNWDALDAEHLTQKIGDKFLVEQKKFILCVPSVLVPEEYNYVLNPLHSEMKQVRIIDKREIRFNDRLTKSF
jgi:RES domain-containing protein